MQPPADMEKARQRSRAVMIVIMLLAAGLNSLSISWLDRFTYSAFPPLAVLCFILLYTLPLMFVAAVYNFPMGIISYLLVELMGMVFYFDRLYILSYQLLALFSVTIFMQKGIYKKFSATLLMALSSALVQGLLLFNLWELSQDRSMLAWNVAMLPAALITALAERLFVYFFLYCFFRFAPRRLILLFPPGKFYKEFRPKPVGMGFADNRGQSALGQKIGRYMVAEGLLVGAGIALFVNALLPGLNAERGQQLIFLIKVNLCVFVESVPIVVAANFIMHNRVINPIRNMTRGMKAFAGADESRAEAEAFIESLKVHTGDELQELYSAMSEMVGEVNRYIGRIEEEQQLKEDLRVAQAASEAKSNFMSHMSHEIRTPINAVIGMDEMIIRETHERNILHYARDIRNAGRSLLGIVNDILDFSRIESGKLQIIPEDYELSSALNDVMSMIMPKAAEKGLEFKIDVDPATPHRLRGDDIRLKQCILNLLSNAVKYTQEGRVKLKLSCESLSDKEIMLEVAVSDTGIGIKAEDLKKLVSPFERIEEERNRTIEGTGLGMSITENLLKLMDSKLTVESEYGRGSSFSFRIAQQVVDAAPIGDFAKSYEALLKNEKKYRESFHAPDARILVVDDTRTNLTVIRGLLRETGIHVDTASSGKEMLERVVEEYYDLIFLDQRMPVMDGIEALHLMEMLSDRKNPAVPVIALTANAISGAREMFLSEGFKDYLSKPVDPLKLEQMLVKHLPKDKLILAGTEGFEEAVDMLAEEPVEDSKESSDDIKLLAERLRHTEGIDYAAAIARCMKDDILIETLKDFRLSATIVPAEIEKCLAEEDYENYTIRVHALKSSAAAVGALSLSAAAARLEERGDAGDAAVLKAETPALLSEYRKYEQRLSFLAKEDTPAEDAEEIEQERLLEAYRAISDFLEAFDYDSAEEVMHMLSAFAIPKSEESRYNKLKELLALLDRDAAIELIAEG